MPEDAPVMSTILFSRPDMMGELGAEEYATTVGLLACRVATGGKCAVHEAL